jgi:hypothetical protein
MAMDEGRVGAPGREKEPEGGRAESWVREWGAGEALPRRVEEDAEGWACAWAWGCVILGRHEEASVWPVIGSAGV